MKIGIELDADGADITKDGEVIVRVDRDDDSATAAIAVLKAIAPLLKPDVEVDL